ncbi:hypothetical protein CWS35_00200 [Bradyrhizobium sp. SK17]|nr:hypothetical protein CWS35_00200 [Bradyrhizobium sp. SK17]
MRGARSEVDRPHQMCRIHKDFKHFAPAGNKDLSDRRKASSIMRANLLSIMAPGEEQLTRLFKLKRPSLG